MPRPRRSPDPPDRRRGSGDGSAAAGPGAATPGRVLPLLPYATVPVPLVVPPAAVLYLVTTTARTVLEQLTRRRPVAVAG